MWINRSSLYADGKVRNLCHLVCASFSSFFMIFEYFSSSDKCCKLSKAVKSHELAHEIANILTFLWHSFRFLKRYWINLVLFKIFCHIKINYSSTTFQIVHKNVTIYIHIYIIFFRSFKYLIITWKLQWDTFDFFSSSHRSDL